ncbi:MAG TPA: signal recognition particle-docking protein FtsY [Bellilinea sp.]|nr:signal recognition particle-docking protein FtsY [Bellilinea sp.]
MAEFFNKWKQALNRSSKAAFGRLATVFGATEITLSTWDELEALLIQADVGIDTTNEIIASLMQRVDRDGITSAQELTSILRAELLSRLDPMPDLDFNGNQPVVILIVGVNGSGKTTTIAKLGRQFAQQGKKVLLAAADTFRAAAVDQLQVWADRLDIPIITGQPNGDPGAVTYDAIQAGVSRKMDLVLVDTAGRLHTRTNLMEELKKVHRVSGKALPGAPHAVWLVLDATTGQNALQQARMFKEAVKVTGIIIAKLDSSARGGMAFAIQKELGIPILYAGLGEKSEDLEKFNRESFVDGILSAS